MTVVHDQRPLLSILKPNGVNKHTTCRLIRWIDRLIAFQFKIQHNPVSIMDLFGLISIKPKRLSRCVCIYNNPILVEKLNSTRILT